MSFSGHTTMRRGWPCMPTMCMAPNVMEMPQNINQKFQPPSFSFSVLPNIFGHQ